jgi:hypothetical protein
MSRRAEIAMSPAEQRALLDEERTLSARRSPTATAMRRPARPARTVRAPRREEMPAREGHPRDRFPLTPGLTRGAHDFLAASPTRRKTRWALPPRIFPTSSGR